MVAGKRTSAAAVCLFAALAAARCDGGGPFVVQDCPGYNSWPMVQSIGNRLVCAYSRGRGHDILEEVRGVYARHSDDFGRTWSKEVCVVNSSDHGECAIGKGLDETGAMLLWVRAYGKNDKCHELYRTADGIRFEKIASPALSPTPIQITDVFAVPGRGLMSLWFAGAFTGDRKSWGTLTSADNGSTWRQKTVECVSCDAEWATEPSAVHLGNGRILAVARTEVNDASARQFQLTSTDFGDTWMRERTNIGDVCYSTPSLVHAAGGDIIFNYHYERGKGLVKRRVCKAADVFSNPLAWPDPQVAGRGGASVPDAGNVNATTIGGRRFIAYYSGEAPNTAVYLMEDGAGMKADVVKVRLGDEAEDGRPRQRWRGFNLLEMCFKTGDVPPPFHEGTFSLIRELGFNFVRIPLDYRYWIVGNDWEKIDESRLGPLDRAIGFARKHSIHVLICLHRCPGYSVAKPVEREPLFSSTNAQRVCAMHWRMLARHYRHVPHDALSFNLVNEPSGVSGEQYAAVARKMIEAIRSEDPGRFIVSDGLRWGRCPEPMLEGMPGIGFAMRGYDPMSLTHYRAKWVGEPSARPVWNFTDDMPRGVMFGPAHKDAVRLVIENLPAGKVQVEYGKCFGPAEIAFTADGETVLRRALTPAKGDSGWYEVVEHPQWNGISGYYRGHDVIELARPVKRLEARTTKGDWTSLNSIQVEPKGNGAKAVLWFRPGFGKAANYHQVFTSQNGKCWFTTVDPVPPEHILYADCSRDWLYSKVFRAWDASVSRGAFLFCGEFGVYRHTPHDLTLRYMEDLLALCKERNIGWAMWQLTGPNGILDSGRDDVEYEDFKGHKLDRKMLTLLQTY